MREPPEPPNGGKHVMAFQMSRWEVALIDGEFIRIGADAYHEQDGAYVFSILMEGTPPYEVDVVAVPAAIISTIYSV